MPEHARVTSLEAIENFRARLIIYRDKAGRVLDEVSEDVVRTRLWLQNDRRTYWQAQIERRTRDLEQRQQELFSAQLSGLREASYIQQMAVQKARRSVREAEVHLQTVKEWGRQFDHRVEPLARHVEKLRHILGTDLGHAVAWLNEATKTLADYAELSPVPGAQTATAPEREPDSSEPPTTGDAKS